MRIKSDREEVEVVDGARTLRLGDNASERARIVGVDLLFGRRGSTTQRQLRPNDCSSPRV